MDKRPLELFPDRKGRKRGRRDGEVVFLSVLCAPVLLYGTLSFTHSSPRGRDE